MRMIFAFIAGLALCLLASNAQACDNYGAQGLRLSVNSGYYVPVQPLRVQRVRVQAVEADDPCYEQQVQPVIRRVRVQNVEVADHCYDQPVQELRIQRLQSRPVYQYAPSLQLNANTGYSYRQSVQFLQSPRYVPVAQLNARAVHGHSVQALQVRNVRARPVVAPPRVNVQVQSQGNSQVRVRASNRGSTVNVRTR